jgi:hypothetical protein
VAAAGKRADARLFCSCLATTDLQEFLDTVTRQEIRLAGLLPLLVLLVELRHVSGIIMTTTLIIG